MRWFWTGLLLLYVICLSVFLKKASYNNQKNIPENVIKMPHWYSYVGVWGMIGFLIIGLCFLLYQKEVTSAFAMFALCIPYALSIIFVRNWKIEIKEDGFLKTNVWGRTRQFPFQKVLLTNTGRAIRIYDAATKKKIVAVSLLFANAEKLETCYQKYHKKLKT